jgi:hypothetical protein
MQVAYLEPRRLQSPRPLPLCPRPFPGEAVDSWIWRIGREFGYTPAKFLRAIGRPSLDPKGPGPVLTKADVSYFATLARLPPNELMAMETIPAPWRLRAVRDQPFCARCWLEDQRLHGFTYVRGSWMHAGRISCDRHGSWLYSVRDRLGSKHCDLAHRAAHGIPAEAIEAIITDEANLERNPRCSWIPEAGACLKSLEAAVVGATAGRSPPEEEWGPIGAREFLNVVHDVTTWSLQNFEDFRAHALPTCITWIGHRSCRPFSGSPARRCRLGARVSLSGHFACVSTPTNAATRYGWRTDCSQPFNRRYPTQVPALTVGQDNGGYCEARTRRVCRSLSRECNDGQMLTEKPVGSALGGDAFTLLQPPSWSGFLKKCSD